MVRGYHPAGYWTSVWYSSPSRPCLCPRWTRARLPSVCWRIPSLTPSPWPEMPQLSSAPWPNVSKTTPRLQCSTVAHHPVGRPRMNDTTTTFHEGRRPKWMCSKAPQPLPTLEPYPMFRPRRETRGSGKRGRVGDDHTPTSRCFGRVGEIHTPTGRLRTLGLSGTSRAPLARFTTERGREGERSVRKPHTHATGLSVSLGQTMRSRGCLGERRRLLARSALRQDGNI